MKGKVGRIRQMGLNHLLREIHIGKCDLAGFSSRVRFFHTSKYSITVRGVILRPFRTIPLDTTMRVSQFLWACGLVPSGGSAPPFPTSLEYLTCSMLCGQVIVFGNLRSARPGRSHGLWWIVFNLVFNRLAGMGLRVLGYLRCALETLGVSVSRWTWV